MRLLSLVAAACSLVLGSAYAQTGQQAPPAASPAAPPAAQRAMPDPWPGKKKLLVYADVQTGFHHESTWHAIATIERLGRETGEWATVIHTDSQVITKQPILGQGTRYNGRPVNAHNLDFYDAIFFLGSGAGTLSDQQKADLLSFVKDDGKGFVAGHAATVAFYEWPEFTRMIGGFMDSEYRVQPMALINEDPAFPGASAMQRTFTYDDQFPVMKQPFSSKDVHVILRLDPTKLTPEERSRRPDGDMPVVWTKNYGKGRVYNLTIGHREEVWDDPAFQKLAVGAIRWALRLENADTRPGNSGKSIK